MARTNKGRSSDASQLITNQIEELEDWRGQMLKRLREIVLGATPGISEEWKWGTAVWVHEGLLCSAGAFKDHVKLNFFKGASLEDPKGLFNAGLDAKSTRAIDLYEGDKIDATALRALVRSAVKYNKSGTRKR